MQFLYFLEHIFEPISLCIFMTQLGALEDNVP